MCTIKYVLGRKWRRAANWGYTVPYFDGGGGDFKWWGGGVQIYFQINIDCPASVPSFSQSGNVLPTKLKYIFIFIYILSYNITLTAGHRATLCPAGVVFFGSGRRHLHWPLFGRRRRRFCSRREDGLKARLYREPFAVRRPAYGTACGTGNAACPFCRSNRMRRNRYGFHDGS